MPIARIKRDLITIEAKCLHKPRLKTKSISDYHDYLWLYIQYFDIILEVLPCIKSLWQSRASHKTLLEILPIPPDRTVRSVGPLAQTHFFNTGHTLSVGFRSRFVAL